MILITGWTGNTGSLVLSKLRNIFPDKQIVGVSREAIPHLSDQLIVEYVDLTKSEDIERIFGQYRFDLVIHIANIKYSPLIMQLSERYKVNHVILIHTTGIYSKYRAFSDLYIEIEREVLERKYSDTSYTILRPTMIYGNSRDHNMHRLIKFLSKWPVYPVFGNGKSLIQPVHVEDLADAVISCINNKTVINQHYDLSGGEAILYIDVLKLIRTKLNKQVLFAYIPIKLAIFMISLLAKILKKSPVTVEQVKRLQEDKAYDHSKAKRDFGFIPRSFKQGICDEIEQLRKEGLIK